MALVAYSLLVTYLRRRIQARRNADSEDLPAGEIMLFVNIKPRSGWLTLHLSSETTDAVGGKRGDGAATSDGETTQVSGTQAFVSRPAPESTSTDDGAIVEVPRTSQ